MSRIILDHLLVEPHMPDHLARIDHFRARWRAAPGVKTRVFTRDVRVMGDFFTVLVCVAFQLVEDPKP